MSPANLVSVLGVPVVENGTTINKDANAIWKTGLYRDNNEFINAPSGWGILIVFVISNVLNFQIWAGGNAGSQNVYVRSWLGNNEWNPWTTIATMK